MATVARMKCFPRSVRWLATIALLSTAPFVRAQNNNNVMKKAAAPAVVHYVKVDPGLAAKVLPEPPAPGSLAANADIETVLQVQAERTPEQVAWAKVVATNDLFGVFGAHELLGPKFTKENYPLLAALVKDVLDDLRPPVDASKKLFSRARPYAIDPRVKPCVELPANDSYPSGHTWNAYVRAAVLSEVFPEKRVELQDRARSAGWARVIGGVHFPTDLDGGRRLAEVGIAELRKSAAFRAAVERCREEAAAVARKKAA
jgi:acid phosphatase (class A)